MLPIRACAGGARSGVASTETELITRTWYKRRGPRCGVVPSVGRPSGSGAQSGAAGQANPGLRRPVQAVAFLMFGAALPEHLRNCTECAEGKGHQGIRVVPDFGLQFDGVLEHISFAVSVQA